MAETQPQQRYEIGMVGLGAMGRNLLLNMADHGFSVAGYDKDPIKVEALRKESADRDICGAENINDFIGLLGYILHISRRHFKINMTEQSLNCKRITGTCRQGSCSAA